MKKLLLILFLCLSVGAIAQTSQPRYENVTASGTNTYTAPMSPTPSLINGFGFRITFTNANTGASTLNVQSTGAVTLRDQQGNALTSGFIGTGSTWWVMYNGSQWRLLGAPPTVGFTLTNGNGTTANGTAVDLGGTLTGDALIQTDAAFSFNVLTNSGLSGLVISDSEVIFSNENTSFQGNPGTGGIQFWDHRVGAAQVGLQENDDYSSNYTARSYTSKSYVDAKIAQTITNGVTTSAPSQDAVFDALANKQPLDQQLTTISNLGTAGQGLRVNAGATDLEYYTPLTNPATTNGDIIYFDGTNFQRLAVGTASQVLKGGTVPVWGSVTVAVGDITGLGTGVATFLGTPSSANLATAVTDETGSGALVFGTSPSFTTPNIGAATATTINGFAIQNAVADGATKGVASFNATYFDAATGIINIDLTNGAASASQGGYVTTGTQTFAGAKTLSGSTNLQGGFQTESGTAASNLAAAAGNAMITTAAVGAQFGGSSSINYRVVSLSGSSTVVGNSNSAANLLLQGPYTEGTSGTHPIFTNAAIKAIVITNGSASTTDATSLYIENAPSGITSTNGNTALWVDNGAARLDGGVKFSSAGTLYTNFIGGSATLNFDLTAVASQDLTIAVTGAADGDEVIIGVPNAAMVANVSFTAWVSATDTVSIRCKGVVGDNPGSGTFKVTVIKR